MVERKPVQSYDEIVEILRQRRQELGLSLMETEAIAGLATGHLTKLEHHIAPGYGRKAGPVVLPLWLGALGLGLQLVELPPEHPYHRAPKPPADRSKFRKKDTGLPDIWNAA